MGLVLENDVWTLQPDNGWVVEYSVDFSDYDSDGTMSTDDTIDVGGVTWTAQAVNGTTEVTSGTGLECQASNSSADFWQSSAVFPYLVADVADMVPNVSKLDQLCFQWVQTYPVAFTTNWQQIGGCIWDGVALASGHRRGLLTWHAFNDGSDKMRSMRGYEDGNTGGQVASSPCPNSLEMYWSFPGQVSVLSTAEVGVTTLDDPLEADHIRTYGSNAVPSANFSTTNWIFDQTNYNIPAATCKFFLYSCWSGNFSSNNFRGVFTKFRVLRYRGGGHHDH